MSPKTTIAFTIALLNLIAALELTSYGFKTLDDSIAFTYGTVTTTLWFNHTIYQCTMYPIDYDTFYSCDSSRWSVIGTYNSVCHISEYKMMIDNSNSGDALEIDQVTFYDNNSNWYGAHYYCAVNNAISKTNWVKLPNLCDNGYTYYSALCIDNQFVDCAPGKQVIYFDINQPNIYPDTSQWIDGTDVTVDIMHMTCPPSTNKPSNNPTFSPTNNPSTLPTNIPTSTPSNNPIYLPSNKPSQIPTKYPTIQPTYHSSSTPTYNASITMTTHYPSSMHLSVDISMTLNTLEISKQSKTSNLNVYIWIVISVILLIVAGCCFWFKKFRKKSNYHAYGHKISKFDNSSVVPLLNVCKQNEKDESDIVTDEGDIVGNNGYINEGHGDIVNAVNKTHGIQGGSDDNNIVNAVNKTHGMSAIVLEEQLTVIDDNIVTSEKQVTPL
eukprot:313228_1